MKIDTNILLHGQDVMPYSDFKDLLEVVNGVYRSSSTTFLMWKMLHIGFVYGKQAERAKRKKNR